MSLHLKRSRFPGEPLSGEMAHPASVGREAAHCNTTLQGCVGVALAPGTGHDWAGDGASVHSQAWLLPQEGWWLLETRVGFRGCALGHQLGSPYRLGGALVRTPRPGGSEGRSGASGHAGEGAVVSGRGTVQSLILGTLSCCGGSSQSGGAQRWHVPRGSTDGERGGSPPLSLGRHRC